MDSICESRWFEVEDCAKWGVVYGAAASEAFNDLFQEKPRLFSVRVFQILSRFFTWAAPVFFLMVAPFQRGVRALEARNATQGDIPDVMIQAYELADNHCREFNLDNRGLVTLAGAIYDRIFRGPFSDRILLAASFTARGRWLLNVAAKGIDHRDIVLELRNGGDRIRDIFNLADDYLETVYRVREGGDERRRIASLFDDLIDAVPRTRAGLLEKAFEKPDRRWAVSDDLDD
jgi:hypothetical protein